MKKTQSPGVQFFKGTPIHVPNEVLQNDPKFYISYNASSANYGSDTTALVLNDPQMSKFYILRGDHRKAYEQAGTWESCLAYYKGNPDKHHPYSDKL